MTYAGLPSLGQLPQLLWAGCTSGLVVGLLACLLVLMFRVSRVINLAVGGIYVTGALIVAAGPARGFGHIALAIFGTAAAGATLGLLQEKFILRRLANAEIFIQLVSTIGLATILEGVVVVASGRAPLGPGPLIGSTWAVGKTWRVSGTDLLIVGISLVVALLSEAWLRRTATGRVLAATTEDAEAATMLGINVIRFRLVIYSVLGALGALAGGVMTSTSQPSYSSVLPLALDALIAAYLFGRGLSPAGALAGGLVVGLVQVTGARIFSSTVSSLLVAALLVLVLTTTGRRAIAIQGR